MDMYDGRVAAVSETQEEGNLEGIITPDHSKLKNKSVVQEAAGVLMLSGSHLQCQEKHRIMDVCMMKRMDWRMNGWLDRQTER